MLLRLTSQLRIYGPVPELFHGFPILNLSATDDVLEIVGFLMLESLITDVVVELWILELLILASNLGSALLHCVCNDRGNQVTRLHIARIAHLSVASTIIYDDRRELAHF